MTFALMARSMISDSSCNCSLRRRKPGEISTITRCPGIAPMRRTRFLSVPSATRVSCSPSWSARVDAADCASGMASLIVWGDDMFMHT